MFPPVIVIVPSLRVSTFTFLNPEISRLESTERISLAEAVPRTVPESKLSSSGVAEIVVVDGCEKGTSVPELFAKLIVLSSVGSITEKVVSKLSSLVPSKTTF